ncbi:uncharacterized protein LOC129583067 isoform X1 [Paramacrobiotus metropolitanus]|uniref:uncharacterized protein LOC129583067 isoform X1 n=1 Tax=Paramacrobiotus metropolitanus TaxID=2943436 RepID=UPI00244611CA|nr:uncharacterized protein LOC129583067 isoform X1 [Paramacrobiotus metropolitanus]
MHRLTPFQRLCCLLFLPVLIGIPTTVHAIPQTTESPEKYNFDAFGEDIFGPFGEAILTSVSEAELLDPHALSPADKQRKKARPCKPYVLSGCSAQWKYCGCDVPAFNLSAIAPNADTIEIGEWNFWVDFCTPSCLLDTFTPLPHRPNVTTVRLHNIWAAPDNRPFPVAGYLVNLQPTLKVLLLLRLYLPTITRDTFAGFVALQKLTVSGCYVSAIETNAFTALNNGPGSALPQLKTLNFIITILPFSIGLPLCR